MKDRIRQIMESQHMTQKTFASFIDMSEGSLSSIFNGRTKPTLNIVDAIKNGQIDLIVDTPSTKKDDVSDSYIRQNAIKHHVPYITTIAGARATAEGIKAELSGEGVPVRSLQEYHAMITE